MGNQASTVLEPNYVKVRKEIFQNHLQKMQSMEREIQDNKAVILDKNNKIDTLTNTINKLLRENNTLKSRSLQELSEEDNKAVILDKNNKIDTLTNTINKLLRENNTLKSRSLQGLSEEDNKAVILDKNNKIDTLTNTINKLLRENNTLKSRLLQGLPEEAYSGRIYSLTKSKEHFEAEYYALKHEKSQLTKSKNELLSRCEQLGEYIRTLQSQTARYESASDTLRKAHDKLLCENRTLRNEKLLLTRSKNEISKKYEESEKYIETLKNEIFEYESVSDTLTKTNDEFVRKNCTLNVEKLHLTEPEDEIKKKCEQLEKHYEKLKSEMAKFESVPTLKQILELFENLREFQRDIKVIETNIFIGGQDLNFLAEKVSNKKAENNKMKNELKQKSLSLQYLHEITQLAVTKEQIDEENKTLQTINLNYSGFVDDKQQVVSSLSEKVKVCMEELEEEFERISDNINRIEEQVKDHKKEFAMLQNKNDQIKKEEQEELYKKILTLLDKQYNILWLLLYLPDDAEEYISNISESDPSTTQHKKHYAVMLYNLKEGTGDQQKVIDIISSICSISTKEIKVQRLGAYNGNRVRPIKVSVPTFSNVATILSNKWKLKKGEYQHISIGSFDKNRGKVKDKQVQKQKSATFAYRN